MAKGGAYEREVAKTLSLWWSGGKTDAVFWRTSNSGGRATVRGRRNLATVNQHGDLCAVDSTGQPFLDLFVCELKRGYSGESIANLLDRHPRMAMQTYEAWIDKAERDREAAGVPYWLLIARRDGRAAMAYLPEEALCRLVAASGKFDSPTITTIASIFVGVRRKVVKNGKVTKQLTAPRTMRISALRLDEFLRDHSPESVRCVLKQLEDEKGTESDNSGKLVSSPASESRMENDA